MGAAKMHMFMMSAVGVMIAAIMKITKNRVTQIAPHPARGDQPEQGQEEHQDRHLKDHAESEHNRHKQTDVLVDRDHRSELQAVFHQKGQRCRIHQSVGEIATGHEQPDGAEHERPNVPALVLVKSGSDERPHLVEHKGRRHKDPGNQADLQIHIEWINRIRVNELACSNYGCVRICTIGFCIQPKILFMPEVADAESNTDKDDAPDHAACGVPRGDRGSPWK